MVETLVVLDPLADLARFEGVASAVAAATDAVDAVLRDRGLRKISDEQLFYCRSRGIAPEDAVSMIVDGFCRQVFRELPMEFAVEAKKLLEVSLEGAVG